MQTYELIVKNRAIVPNSYDMTLVRTSVGIDQVHILFDNEEWLEFPILMTFAQGSDVLTVPVEVSVLDDSDDWVAEATVTVPFEVIDMNGRIAVTIQGTSSDGRHIITARSRPMSVEEAGDVVTGEAPAGSPTDEQWAIAYASAIEAVENAEETVATLRAMLQDIINEHQDAIGEVALSEYAKIADVQGVVDAAVEAGGYITELPVASTESSGIVKPDGTTITVDGDGTIHGSSSYELPPATTAVLGGVKPDGSTITVDSDGTIHGADATPIATTSTPGKVMPDGTTITIGENGLIHAAGGVGSVTVRYGYVGNSSYDSKAYIIGDESDGVYDFPTVTTIVSGAFNSCASLKEVSFPECVSVGRYAFESCANLVMADLPKCTTIQERTFFYCGSLASVSLPACLTVAGNAFDTCRNLATVSLPSCTSIGGGAFYACRTLSSVYVPACESIGAYAFYNCSYIASIALPACTNIGSRAFHYCVRLQTLDLAGVSSVPTLVSTDAFFQTPIAGYTAKTGTYGLIVVPRSLYSSFRTAPKWSYYSARMVSV